MPKHYVESWPEARNISHAASEIAKHLQVRSSVGSAIIVAKQPIVFLSAVRKHWMKLYRSLQIERARTLDPVLRRALTHEIEVMERLRFVAKQPREAEGDVFFVAPQGVEETLPDSCRTIYTQSFTPESFQQFLVRPEAGVIIQYSLRNKS